MICFTRFCFESVTKIFVGQGCDIQKDAIVLKSGELVGASEIGLLATVGVMMVKVLWHQNFILHLILIHRRLMHSNVL